MKDIAYYNGLISEIDKMMIPMNDRASFLGDGVYDATGVMNHVPLALDDHLERFYNSAAAVRITIPMEKQEMKQLLVKLVQKVDDPTQFLYMQVTRGIGPRNHLFRYAGEKASIWVFSRPHVFADVFADYKAITVEDTRFFHCNIKTIDLLPNVLASQKAEEAGCQIAIFHRGDRVTECAHSNVHIIKNGTLITAPLDNLILPGITRKHIISICNAAGIPVEERPFTIAEMMEADEIFSSSASAISCRISEIDGIPAGKKDENTFGKIRDAYQKEILSESRLGQVRT